MNSRNRSLCTKFIIYAIILYGDQIVRRPFFMAPLYYVLVVCSVPTPLMSMMSRTTVLYHSQTLSALLCQPGTVHTYSHDVQLLLLILCQPGRVESRCTASVTRKGKVMMYSFCNKVGYSHSVHSFCYQLGSVKM